MTDFLLKQIKKRGRVIRYLVSGGTATAANLIFLYVLTDGLGLWYLFSAILAFIGSFLISFFLQKLWTFQDKDKEQTKRQLILSLLLALLNLAGNTFLMYLLVDFLGIWYMLAQAIVSALIAFWNYNVFRIFIFKPVKAVNE